ncbi:MAG: hypothetical protein K9G60_05030 [Pseudolabrys sp.]|nr:hypothetical protein [Pseudolabrys sp.]
MATDSFRAGVQYGDWTGTTAADDADGKTFRDLLIERGLMDPEQEFLIGASLYVGENHGGKVQMPYLHAVMVEGTKFDDIQPRLKKQADPIATKRIDLELTFEEFLILFKRFNVVITRRGLDLEGREYQWEDA